MDLRRRLWVVSFIAVMIRLVGNARADNVMFNVRHKFAGRERNLGELKAHDTGRHSRILSVVNLPLGGDTVIGLYYTKIGLGTPSNTYYVQVDTGSDVLWVNCAGCARCPKNSKPDKKHTFFDAAQSSTAKLVPCDDNFCVLAQQSTCQAGSSCQYVISYGDGSSTLGHYVRDKIQLDKVTGSHQTGLINETVAFGCSTEQKGQLEEFVVDGIMGFGRSNSSLISQLAATGNFRRAFAHCLDNVNGGGIFFLGEVVSPKVKMAPLIPDQMHYNLLMKAVEVDGVVLELPTSGFDSGDSRITIIDSGTTLTYLPDIVYDSLISKILARQPGLKLRTEQKSFTCFRFTASVDDGLPSVTFHFEGSLSLTVHPRDYLLQTEEDYWCIGWQKSMMTSHGGAQMTILGDIALSNKLVVYDIDNQVIGWTEHNCSSGIKVKDGSPGGAYSVSAQNLSSSSFLEINRLLTFLAMLIALFRNFEMSSCKLYH